MQNYMPSHMVGRGWGEHQASREAQDHHSCHGFFFAQPPATHSSTSMRFADALVMTTFPRSSDKGIKGTRTPREGIIVHSLVRSPRSIPPSRQLEAVLPEKPIANRTHPLQVHCPFTLNLPFPHSTPHFTHIIQNKLRCSHHYEQLYSPHEDSAPARAR
ncbi:hypothetical protein DL93DRAFT_277395 [Clavulina sp. PMI_390]|nr:hypothetical protein DL93DRAFT_277395 [Clavulina sp. PMI_390]